MLARSTKEDNGQQKLDEDFLATFYEVVASAPQEHGWRRLTWTREILRITLQHITGISIHVSTMSRALKKMGARHGRPKPWGNFAKAQPAVTLL